jgi:NitT/TauT family transport system substrate-binding protein
LSGTGNTAFVRNHPIATKRVIRAILKATDLCAAEPQRAARRLVDGGVTASYDDALQTLNEVPYGAWRDFDPEDTMRFFALRLHEAGMIRSTPQPAHRRGHRLALPQRAEARAEGVSQVA